MAVCTIRLTLRQKINLRTINTTKPKYCCSCAHQIFGRQLSAPKSSRNKVSIIGTGNVGQAIAAILLLQKITNNIVLISSRSKHLNEVVSSFQMIKNVDASGVTGSYDFSATCNSHVCVITSAAPEVVQKTRRNFIDNNSKVFFNIIPNIAKNAPESILIVVSNPVDALTYLTAKISGFPRNKVFGCGTNLDTARLRYLMSQKYGVSVENCEGWVIGKHGESAVTAFSTCKVGGIFIGDYNKNMGNTDDVDNWSGIHKTMLGSGIGIAKKKGYTNWGVALSVGDMIKSILNNNRSMHAVSVSAEGFYGIRENVYLSLPVVLGEDGIVEIVRLQLTADERTNLKKCADSLYLLQKQLKI